MLATISLAAAEPEATAPPGEVVELEPLVVRDRLIRAMDDFAQPFILLEREDLAPYREPSIGETIDGLPGISSTNHFPGASRPIIRGFSNFRVRVLRNSLDTIDASIATPDHAVTIEPYRVEEIEIVRGPASLLYGGDGIGGVVNVIDAIVPMRQTTRPVEGSLEGSFETVSDGTTGAFALQTGLFPVELAIGGLKRRSGDISIPGFGATDPRLQALRPHGVLDNSHVNTDEFHIGASRFFPAGWLGGGFNRFRTDYGVGSKPESDVVGIAPDGSLIVAREFCERVTIDLDQRRFDLRGEFAPDGDFIQAVSWRAGAADYEHHEVKAGNVETTFLNRGFETRFEFARSTAELMDGSLEGTFGFEAGFSESSAIGDEAFLRPSDTWRSGLFALEELRVDQLTWQLGARLDYKQVSPDWFAKDFLALEPALPPDYRELGFSGAGGALWDFAPGWRAGTTLSYTERLLNAHELYVDGPHLATFAYEISDHIEAGNFDKERAVGIDLSLRRTAGRVTGEISGFGQIFPRFVSVRRTSEIAFVNSDGTFTLIDSQQVDQAFLDQRAAAGEGAGFFAVTRNQLTRAIFTGAELEVTWHVVEEMRSGEPALDWTWRVDFVHAQDRALDEPLPRIPPLRFGTELAWRMDGYFAGVDVSHMTRQTRTAGFETETPAYTLTGLGAGRRWERNNVEWLGFVRFSNIFNEEARNHTSFVKDLAPLPGRNLKAGISMIF